MKGKNVQKSHMKNTALRRKRHLQIKRLFLCAMLSLSVMVTICISTGFNFAASRNPYSDINLTGHKYYKSIQLKSGDTLWDIAQKHMDEMYYDSVTDYIRELKAVNSLSSDNIQEGQYLTIPYYDSI